MSDTVQSLLQKLIAALEREDFDEVIEICAQIINHPDANDEQKVATYGGYGVAYEYKGEYDHAIQNFNKAIEIKPDYASSYYGRGSVYAKKGEHDRAIQDYDKAIELRPNHAESYNNRGNAYGEKGEHDHAIQDYNKAIELNPKYAEAYYNHGIAYGKKEEHDHAIKNYDKAIELKPDFAEAYRNRGITHGKKEEYDHAIKDFDKAIELVPDNVKAYYNRGNAYRDKGEYDHAIKDFNKIIELKPNDADAYNGRGIVYGKKEEYGHAIRDFDKAIELRPDYSEAIHNRATAMAYKDAERTKQEVSAKYEAELKGQIKKQQEKFDKELGSRVVKLIDYYAKREKVHREKLGEDGENDSIKPPSKAMWASLFTGLIFLVVGLIILIFSESLYQPSHENIILTTMSSRQELDCCHVANNFLLLYAKLSFLLAGFFILLFLFWRLIQIRQVENRKLKERFYRGIAELFFTACIVYSIVIGLYAMFFLGSSGEYGVVPFIFVGTLILSPIAWKLRALRQDTREEIILAEDAHTNYVLMQHITRRHPDVSKEIYGELLKQFFDHHDKRGSAQLIASLYRPTEKNSDSIIQTIANRITKEKE